MDLTTPIKHPVGTGLRAVSWSIGMIRSGVVAAATLVMPEKNDEPATRFDETPQAAPPAEPPRTQEPRDIPTPADLAERVYSNEEVTTPVGTTGAGRAYNPDTTDTDLQQPDTEPLMDPATTKAVAAEAETGARGADTDKG
jgi:hypothetical protein